MSVEGTTSLLRPDLRSRWDFCRGSPAGARRGGVSVGGAGFSMVGSRADGFATISDIDDTPRVWMGAICLGAGSQVPERALRFCRSFAEVVPNLHGLGAIGRRGQRDRPQQKLRSRDSTICYAGGTALR